MKTCNTEATILVKKELRKFGIIKLCQLMDDHLPETIEDEQDFWQLLKGLWPALLSEQATGPCGTPEHEYIQQLEKLTCNLLDRYGLDTLLAQAESTADTVQPIGDILKDLAARPSTRVSATSAGAWQLGQHLVIKAGAEAWLQQQGCWISGASRDPVSTIDTQMGTVTKIRYTPEHGEVYTLRLLRDEPQISVELPMQWLETASDVCEGGVCSFGAPEEPAPEEPVDTDSKIATVSKVAAILMRP